MSVKSDIEIARAANKKPIMEIGDKLGIPSADLLPYGHDKAKVSQKFINSVQDKEDGKLILVTAINPTPAGEGKTTTTVGLGDGLNKIGKNAMICIREASLGPNFGMKGARCWWWLCTSCANGRNEPSFHRRLPRNYICTFIIISDD